MISSYSESFDMDSAPETLLENVTFWRNGSDPEERQWSLHVKRLELCKGSIYSVLGDNMVGKSTLLRIVGKSEQVDFKGAADPPIDLRGASRQDKSVLHLPTGQVCLLAHDDPMFPELSIWENVHIARYLGRHQDHALAKAQFLDILKSTPVLHSRSPNERLGQLSSGGKALIKLARACCWAASIILIDEVTAHLDQSNAQGFFSILGRFMPADATVALVSHATRDHGLASELAAQLDRPYHAIQIERGSDGTCYIGR